MEGNLLKLHRQDSNRTGRHADEAIEMALLTVDGYLQQIEYDFDRFAAPENQIFLQGLLISCDPYINQELREVVMTNDTAFDAKEYFRLPIQCLLRIEKSIDLWNEDLGSNGYFMFIEGELGYLVEQDDKMNFSVLVKEDEV